MHNRCGKHSNSCWLISCRHTHQGRVQPRYPLLIFALWWLEFVLVKVCHLLCLIDPSLPSLPPDPAHFVDTRYFTLPLLPYSHTPLLPYSPGLGLGLGLRLPLCRVLLVWFVAKEVTFAVGQTNSVRIPSAITLSGRAAFAVVDSSFDSVDIFVIQLSKFLFEGCDAGAPEVTNNGKLKDGMC